MKNLCRTATAALASGLLLAPIAVLAQSSAPAAQGSQAAPAGQYEGVSHPPPDDTIQASPDQPPAPAAPVQAKPLPGVRAPSVTNRAPASATQPVYSNTGDDGIVGEEPAGSVAGQPDQPGDVHLIPREPENPGFGIVSLVASPSNQLAEGTNIRARLLQGLSTSTTENGSIFRAQVTADVYKEGRVVIPVGSELRGHVVSVSQGHRLGSAATLRLRPESVVLPDGSAYHLYAQAVESDAPGTKTDAEGGIQPSSQLVRNMVEYGAGTGGGAATGAVLGGPAGAAAGAIVGAGIVTTHLLLQHPREAVVEQGSEITFSLTQPMDLVAARN